MLINDHMRSDFHAHHNPTMPPPPVTRVKIYGVVTSTADPMWSDERTDYRVAKTCKVEDLPETVSRWLTLRREITTIREAF